MNLQMNKDLICPTTNIVYLDIEANGLDPTEIHCAVTKRPHEVALTHLSSRSLAHELQKGGQVCGHNLIGMIFLLCLNCGASMYIEIESSILS